MIEISSSLWCIEDTYSLIYSVSIVTRYTIEIPSSLRCIEIAWSLKPTFFLSCASVLSQIVHKNEKQNAFLSIKKKTWNLKVWYLRGSGPGESSGLGDIPRLYERFSKCVDILLSVEERDLTPGVWREKEEGFAYCLVEEKDFFMNVEDGGFVHIWA